MNNQSLINPVVNQKQQLFGFHIRYLIELPGFQRETFYICDNGLAFLDKYLSEILMKGVEMQQNNILVICIC